MMGEVMFPVIAKLKWQDQMAFDLDLSATDFRVGFAIGWAINRHRGSAFISQDKLAVKIGVNVRTIQRSVDNLERRGHLRVHRRDGRGSLGGSLPAVLDRADRESRPRGTEFELWLADQVGCEHSTIIDQVSPQQLFALQRRHASGQDLSEELSELGTKIAAVRHSKESR